MQENASVQNNILAVAVLTQNVFCQHIFAHNLKCLTTAKENNMLFVVNLKQTNPENTDLFQEEPTVIKKNRKHRRFFKI